MAGDSFLSDPSKKRKRSSIRKTKPSKHRKASSEEREVEDSDLDDYNSEDEHLSDSDNLREDIEEEVESEEEFLEETATDKRRRLAKQYLENLKSAENLDNDAFNAQDLDDDILARRLQRDVAESQGHIYKLIGERIHSQIEDIRRTTVRIGSRSLTDFSISYPHLYTVSKDVELIKWDISSNLNKPRRIKHTRGGPRFYDLKESSHLNHHYDTILCVAASPDGRYVVTGGKDARIIIWSTENLSCLKVLDVRCQVNSICFRRGTDQLYAACSDLRVRTFSINQFTQLEVLYGHQDNVTDISALSRESCVTVGSRDKTAMFWKISEESRLIFRGGDNTEKNANKKKSSSEKVSDTDLYMEGSIDCVSLIDETHFITGSDNGNVSLWSLAKKKALSTQRICHGVEKVNSSSNASAEKSADRAAIEVPKPQPYWITTVHGIPFSDVFLTGSFSGELKVWRISSDGFRKFELIGVVPNIHGCIVKIGSVEVSEKKLIIYVLTSKEHKFGRWLKKIDGARNSLVSFALDI